MGRVTTSRYPRSMLQVLALAIALHGCGDAGGDLGPARCEGAPAPEPPSDPAALSACGEAMQFYQLRNLEMDPAVLDGCERFLGSIQFQDVEPVDTTVLSSLRWIDGQLAFFGLFGGGMTSLPGLERIEHVGELSLRFLEIEDLAFLARLRSVAGLMLVSSNDDLRSLHGLERLEEIGELNLDVSPDATDVVTLSCFASLRRIHGDVQLWNVRRDEVDAFLARVEVGGTVSLDGEVIPLP